MRYQWLLFITAVLYTYGPFLVDMLQKNENLFYLLPSMQYIPSINFLLYSGTFVLTIATLRRVTVKFQLNQWLSQAHPLDQLDQKQSVALLGLLHQYQGAWIETATAGLVAQESGRDVLEFNASDVRSEKAVQEAMNDISGSFTI